MKILDVHSHPGFWKEQGMDPTHMWCSCAVLCTLTSCKYPCSCPREQQECHDMADLCWHAPGFLKIWNHTFLHKRRLLRAFNQQQCCSIPLCPHRLVGGKGCTQGTQLLCWKSSKQSAPSAGNGGNGMCRMHWRGHFHSLRAILCEADGPGTLCHLVVRNPQRTCEVAGLTPYPSPLSLCQHNFRATHSFTCTVLSLSGTLPSLSPGHHLHVKGELYSFRYGWFRFPERKPCLLLEHALRQLFPLQITLSTGIVEIHRRWSSCKPSVEALATKQRFSAKKNTLGNICVSCLWPNSMHCNFISLLLIKKAMLLLCPSKIFSLTSAHWNEGSLIWMCCENIQKNINFAPQGFSEFCWEHKQVLGRPFTPRHPCFNPSTGMN